MHPQTPMHKQTASLRMMQQSSTNRDKRDNNQMYLVDLSRAVADADTQQDVLNETRGLWRGLYKHMEPTETLWVISPNDYRDGRLWPIAMSVADRAREESDLILKSIITVHHWEDRDSDMESAYDEILFFVKNKREYQFHKDNIRVSHVYEGNEWGGTREKGNSAYHDTKVRRYNPDGKDPGNVWMNEDRTKTDNMEVDETVSFSIEEAVRRCILAGSAEGEVIHTLWTDNVEAVVIGENREMKPLKVTELRARGI